MVFPAMIDSALQIALNAHRGQKDKAGQPYILHPLRVMAKMSSEDEQCAALLHDVLEDSAITAEELQNQGISSLVVAVVLTLTRTGGLSYDDYIKRVAAHPIARKIKLADIEDNINILRLREVSELDYKRLKKYHKSWHILNQM